MTINQSLYFSQTGRAIQRDRNHRLFNKNFEPSQMVEEELRFKEWCRNSWRGLPEEIIQKKMLALVTCSYGSRDERTICFAVAEIKGQEVVFLRIKGRRRL